MNFRPCIDIHNGKVKQIVGGSLRDAGCFAEENFVSEATADVYADLYKQDGLYGGHIILLNAADSPYYKEDLHQAKLAFQEYPGGFQIGGGVTAENAETFLDMGASHVIVTSYVFQNGTIQHENLEKLVSAVGKERIVLDLSCRKKINEDGKEAYYIVTNRWQKFTDMLFDIAVLDELSCYCDEFLVHAVDMEGKARGIEETVASILGSFSRIPVTYAGGVASFEDLRRLYKVGSGHVDVTIGSALDLFGGTIPYNEVVSFCREVNA